MANIRQNIAGVHAGSNIKLLREDLAFMIKSPASFKVSSCYQYFNAGWQVARSAVKRSRRSFAVPHSSKATYITNRARLSYRSICWPVVDIIRCASLVGTAQIATNKYLPYSRLVS
jgi:hypothetical protein